MDNIHYTKLMFEIEKLEEKIERLEKILLSRSASECGDKKISAEDFSRFWNEERVTKFNSFHLDDVGVPPTEAGDVATKHICIWDNIQEEDRTKPMGISCTCGRCSPKC